MASRLIAFRCPQDILDRLDRLALSLRGTRTAIILEAARLLAMRAREQGGFLTPLYTDKELAADPLFAKKKV